MANHRAEEPPDAHRTGIPTDVMPRAPVPPVALVLGATIVAGAALRLIGVDRIVVQGDEVHALRSALGQGFGRIVSDFGETDKCIPIALLGRCLARTVGLDEWGLRLLPLVAGLATLALATAASSHIFRQPAERVLFIAALATSPILVFWSRHARPYSVAVLLGGAALLLAWKAYHSGTRRGLLQTAAVLALLHAFTLTAVPFTAGLGAAGIFLAATEPPGARRRRLRQVLATGAATALATLVFYAPSIPSLWTVFPEKRAAVTLDASTWIGAGRILCGRPAADLSNDAGGLTAWTATLPVGALAALILLGAGTVFRRCPRLAGAIALILVVPAIAHSVLGLDAASKPVVFLRYQAASIPLLLALVVIGAGSLIAAFSRGNTRAGSIGFGAAFAALAVSIATGPIAEPSGWSGSHGLRASSLLDRGPLTERADPARFPSLYGRLAERPEPRPPVVEWPATPAPRHLYAIYAAHHRHPIRVAYPDFASDPGIRTRFRTIVFGQDGIARAVRDGAMLIVHHDGPSERASIARDRPLGSKGPGRGRRPRDLDSMLARCRAAFGEPFAEDASITAFQAPLDR